MVPKSSFSLKGLLSADFSLASHFIQISLRLVGPGDVCIGYIKADFIFGSKTNAGIIHGIFTEVARTCPNAISAIVTNPVNSTVPVAAEALRTGGAFDPTRLFGVTTLDVVRASTFIAHALGNGGDPQSFKVPVIGGHSGATILPLYSHAAPKVEVDSDTLAKVINSAWRPLPIPEWIE